MSAEFQPIDLQRCADALDALGEDIEKLGERLCGDPAVLAGHLSALQDIDRIAQLQRGVARVLRADMCGHELSRTGLDELIERLRAGHA